MSNTTFCQLTPYAIPANLLAAPAVFPATVLGVAAAVVSTVSVGVATPLAWLGAAPTALIALDATVLARLPGAALAWPGGRVLDLSTAGVVAAVGLNRWTRLRRSRRL